MKAKSLPVLLVFVASLAMATSSCALFAKSYQPEAPVFALANQLAAEMRLETTAKYYRITPPPLVAEGAVSSAAASAAAALPAGRAKPAVIFYPGAKVAPLAYLPLWERVSQTGYTIFISRMPLDFAFLDARAAARIIAAYPDHPAWVISGHSLGGAMAGEYLKKNQPPVRGLILLGSYLAGNNDQSGSGLSALSIREESGLPGSTAKAEAVRGNLPAGTVFRTVTGGNHAQFGSYGIQKDDSPAEISSEEQQRLTAAWILEFLEELAAKP